MSSRTLKADLITLALLRKRDHGAYRQEGDHDKNELLATTPASKSGTNVNEVPSENVSVPEAVRFKVSGFQESLQHFRNRLAGWRCGVIAFAMCASVVFSINFSVTVWSLTPYRSNQSSLAAEDCGYIKRLNTGIHIVINIFSTVLLSGSNYCMQCLAAPTRRDVDFAHAEDRWLDIGVPSVFNLTRISRRRFFLWLWLGLSSLPLHLL